MDLETLRHQEKLIWMVRNRFRSMGLHEVVPAMLQPSVPLEPNIYPFSTTRMVGPSEEHYYLPTSPESSLKAYLALGETRCFAVAKAFRNHEPSSPIHSPEFLMVEWYEENRTCEDMMDQTRDLIMESDRTVGDGSISRQPVWNRYPIPDLLKRHAGVRIEDVLDPEAMTMFMGGRGYNTAGATWEQLFNQLLLNEIQPKLGTEPYFLTDYPSSISPLCRPMTGSPHLCDRFELFVGGVELANGNTENTDGASVREVFVSEHHVRAGTHSNPPVDARFLEDLNRLRGRTISGVGVGLDRLLMLVLGERDIRRVLWDR